MNFAQTLRITDISDYISPSEICIVPVKVDDIKKTGPKIKLGVPDEKVSITLNDCLACSGCVTTAETVLINEQSNATFLSHIKELKHNNKESLIVVSLSPQSIASLSVRFNLGNLFNTQLKLRKFFRSLSVDVVLNTNYGRYLSLNELAIDVNNRISDGVVIASACPGWVCYAEKHKENEILVPLISKVRSPQHMMGMLIKRVLPRICPQYKGRLIYHVAVMPCFDKKLEASRKEFTFVDDAGDDTLKEVDLVLSSVEVESLIVDCGYQFDDDECVPHEVERIFAVKNDKGEEDCFNDDVGGSGGYLEAALRLCSKERHGIVLDDDLWNDPRLNVCTTKDKNGCVLTLYGDNEHTGSPLLTFAYAYGFSKIQNIVQRIRKGVCQYNFVEVMACPSGCLNGGGQVKTKEGFEAVKDVYRSGEGQPHRAQMNEVVETVSKLLDDRSELYTSYNIVKPFDQTNATALRW